MTVAGIAEVLGGRKALRKQIETSSDLARATRGGLPVHSLDTLARGLAMPRGEVAKLLGISVRTLSRRCTSNSRLTAAESDRMVRLARVLAQAQETLGSKERPASGCRHRIGRLRATGPLTGWTPTSACAAWNRFWVALNTACIADADLN